MPDRTIREIIEITGTTEKALRYYDEKGIIHPTSKGKSGRREWLYDDEALKKIRWVVLYRKLNMGIEDIGKMVNSRSCCEHDVLAKRLDALRTERTELDRKISLAELLLLVERMPEGDEKEKLFDEIVEMQKGE